MKVEIYVITPKDLITFLPHDTCAIASPFITYSFLKHFKNLKCITTLPSTASRLSPLLPPCVNLSTYLSIHAKFFLTPHAFFISTANATSSTTLDVIVKFKLKEFRNELKNLQKSFFKTCNLKKVCNIELPM